MVVVFFGYGSWFKKFLAHYDEEYDLYEFYRVHHAMLIPIHWERRIGLFNPRNKGRYIEIDDLLEKRLLTVPKGSPEKVYHKEIITFLKQEHKKQIYYETHKEEIEAKDNAEFIKFLKTIGIIFGILLFIFLISKIFF